MNDDDNTARTRGLVALLGANAWLNRLPHGPEAYHAAARAYDDALEILDDDDRDRVNDAATREDIPGEAVSVAIEEAILACLAESAAEDEAGM